MHWHSPRGPERHPEPGLGHMARSKLKPERPKNRGRHRRSLYQREVLSDASARASTEWQVAELIESLRRLRLNRLGSN